MLFIGAGGLAAQLFDDLVRMNLPDVVFWSETPTPNKFISDRFLVISNDEQVMDHFNTIGRSFVLCVGNSEQRKKMAEKFIAMGGKLESFISPFAVISPHDVTIGHGTMVLNLAEMEAGAHIGEHCLINKKSYYGHGCKLDSYCEVGPTAIISAEASIGEGSLIGIGAIILPRIKIGRNVIVSAGSVVTKNIADNAVVSGVPAAVRFYKKQPQAV
jgi:sugar O-acyltransferase (sialic acid O-acetyltransferase NeuD family)